MPDIIRAAFPVDQPGCQSHMTITLPDIVILAILLIIIVSLFSGMYYMLHDRGQSTRAVKALTVRIVISLILFAILMIGYWTGWLHPHGLLPPPHH